MTDGRAKKFTTHYQDKTKPMYVLKRIEDGKFVAKHGHKVSYTLNICAVRIFKDKKEAEKEKCGNEIIVPVSDIY